MIPSMFAARICVSRVPVLLCRGTSQSVVRGKLPRGKVPRGSTELPFMPAVLNQMRQDVLINPTFKDQVIFLKRSWLTMSSASESAVKVLKKAVELGKDNAVDQRSVLLTLSDEELVLLVGELVHTQPLPLDDKHLQAIERECCHRACQLDTVSLLTVADAFYMMGYQFWAYFSVLASQIGLRWESLKIKRQDILQLAFYVSYLRKAPIHLMYKIEKFVHDNSDEFSANDIGLICHAFFATNTSFRNYSLLDRIAQTTLSNLGKDKLKPYLLSNILKSLRHAHFLNIQFYDELGQCLCRVKSDKVQLKVNDFANIASTYSSLRVTNSELFAFISSSVVKLAKKPKLVQQSFRTKDLCRLIWSFGQLCEPIDHTICKILVDKLENDVQLAYKYPEVFTEALVSLAMQKIYPCTLYDILFSQSFLKLKSSMYHFFICIVFFQTSLGNFCQLL
jgi:hypothetical protein